MLWELRFWPTELRRVDIAQQVLTITQLNEYIRGRMDADPLLTQVAVKGEISNY